MNRLCAIDECTKPISHRDWCSAHYQKWRKYGDPSTVMRRPTSPQDRLWSKVDSSAGSEACWPFTRARRNGYGVLGAGGYTEAGSALTVYAHRVAYEIAVGPIPEGYQIDHLCRNRACCNPAHLEAVTQQVNIQRQAAAAVANRTHCRRGHPWIEENIHRTKSQNYCRLCIELRQQEKRAA